MIDTIAGRLHFLRDAAGATLDQVAAATAMSKSQLWALEADRVPRPSVQTISRLAVYYGVTVECSSKVGPPQIPRTLLSIGNTGDSRRR